MATALDGPPAASMQSRFPARTVWGYLNVLLRHRYLLIALPLVTAGITATLTLRSKRAYVASAAFIPQAPQSSESGLGMLASQFGISVGSRTSTTSPQFYSDLLVSKEVLRDVVLTEYTATGIEPFRGNLVRYFSISESDPEAAAALAAEYLKGNISRGADRATGVVRLSVRTRSPALSAQVANRFVELVNEYNLRRRQSQAQMERRFVESRLQSVEKNLAAAEGELSDFFRRNRQYQGAPELVAEEARLQRRVSLQQQLFVTLSQNREAAEIEEVRNTPVITLLERPETFVEPAARGTVRKTFLALIIGFLLAVVIAFAREVFFRSVTAQSSEYEEFQAMRREIADALRRGIFWRLRRTGNPRAL